VAGQKIAKTKKSSKMEEASCHTPPTEIPDPRALLDHIVLKIFFSMVAQLSLALDPDEFCKVRKTRQSP
jgi:hypothetical protein